MTSLKEESFSENDIIDPYWVIRYLLIHLPRENISAETTIEAIKKMCRKISGVRIKYEKDVRFKDYFIVHGLFDDQLKKSIIITLSCSSYKKRFTMDEDVYHHLITEVADALCHESIHRYQSSARYYDPEKDRDDCGIEYYADPDEMFAYAINIAHNLDRKFGEDAIKKMNNITALIKEDGYLSDYYALLYKTPQFNKILKMIYQNLQSIKQGRIAHRPYL